MKEKMDLSNGVAVGSATQVRSLPYAIRVDLR